MFFAQSEPAGAAVDRVSRISADRAVFDRFLRRVRRRFVILRVLERTGLGLLGGCGAALPLLGIVLWRGLPSLPIAAAALIGGGLAGALWGILTRPNTLAAAMEADRQLQWADLLSSAWMVATRHPHDPYAAAVMRAADARCRAASPSSVLLNRLGARAWGGIGLAAALVVVLGLLPSVAISTRAGERAASPGALAALTHQETPSQASSLAQPRRTAREQDPEELGGTHVNGVEQPPPQPRVANGVQDPPPENHLTERESTGQGSGTSRSPDHPDGQPFQTPDATDAHEATQSARPAGGVGRTSGSGVRPRAAGESAGLSAKSSQPPPPWRASGWPDDVRHALGAVESGRVPDAYRDMIRGYFERQ